MVGVCRHVPGAVATWVENARLLVVLYEAGGCVFTEATLQSLRLTADKVRVTFFSPLNLALALLLGLEPSSKGAASPWLFPRRSLRALKLTRS